MDPRLDAILVRVAAGELSPDDALLELDRAGGPTADPPPRPGPQDPWNDRVATLAVRTSYRSVQILGDPTVRELHVAGAHVLRREGDRLILDNPDFNEADADRRPPGDGRASAGFYNFTNVPWGRRARAFRDDHLVVRVNPTFFLEVDVSGCQLEIARCTGGSRLRVLASKLQLDAVAGPIDLNSFSSAVKGSLLPTGDSSIDSESSSIKVALLAGADLRISVRNRMGKVMLPSVYSKGGIADPDLTETTIGSGRHALTIDAMMSSVMMSAGA